MEVAMTLRLVGMKHLPPAFRQALLVIALGLVLAMVFASAAFGC